MVRFTKASLQARTYEFDKGTKISRVAKYYQYIKSDRWQKKKKKLIKNWECVICGCRNKKRLNVHHKDYKNLFNESKNDLMVLCSECHIMWHSLENPTKQKVKDIIRAYQFEEELDTRLDMLLM